MASICASKPTPCPPSPTISSRPASRSPAPSCGGSLEEQRSRVMVQVVENWSLLTGTGREVKADPELPDPLLVTVEVDAVDPVARRSGDHYPNLLADTAGQRLVITVPRDAGETAGLAPGRRMRATVQRSSPFRCFAAAPSVAASQL